MTDAAGVGVPGVTVSFIVTAGGGRVFAPVLATDAAGLVSVPWTLGVRAGEAQRLLVAVADPVSGASYGLELNATAEAGPPATLRMESGNDQLGGAGSALSQALVVRVRDAFENGVPGVDVEWVVTSGGGSVTAGTTATTSDGLTSVGWTLGLERAPAQSVTASVSTLDPIIFDAAAGLASEWEVLPVMPRAVRAPATAASGNFVYVIGGMGVGGRSDFLQIFDVAAGTWSLGTPAPGSADWWSAAFVGGLLHLVGGVVDGGASDQHWIYDPDLDSWTSGAPIPAPSAGSAIASDGQTLYLMGGRNGAAGYSTAMHIYDGATGTWTAGDGVPQARSIWSGDWIDGRVLAAGGEVSQRGATPDLYSYDPVTGFWSQEPRLLRGRASHGAAAVGGYFCVFGGRAVGSSVACYSPDTGVWADASSMPLANEEIGAVTLAEAVYVVGGRGPAGALHRYAWRFTLR